MSTQVTVDLVESEKRFLKQIQQCKNEVKNWPAWMKYEAICPSWMTKYHTDL